jgi:thiol-disulfide isomerase/thioredoxin
VFGFGSFEAWIMKAQTCFLAVVFAFLVLPGHAAQTPFDPPKEYRATNGEFDSIGRAILDLLQSKDAARFATNVSVSEADWNSLITTNLTDEEKDRVSQFAKGAHYNVSSLESAGKSFLNRADSLHLDFSKNSWRFEILPPEHLGNIYIFAGPTEGGTGIPNVELLEVMLAPGTRGAFQTNDCCKLTLGGVTKFPTGWRVREEVQWKSFPANLMDKKTARELAVLDKIANRKPITSDDDPALLKLGEGLIRFIRSGDIKFYEKDLMINLDLVWAQMQKMGETGPSRQEMEEQAGPMLRQQDELVRAVLKQMTDSGIELTNADIQIKSASVENARSSRRDGSLDGLSGERFKLTLSVKSNVKGKTGSSLSGDYVLGADQIMCFDQNWRVAMNLRWEQFPAGVLDGAAGKNLEFENYVAENRALPPRTAAPEIEFTTLAGDKKMKLSDLRGKMVILDFWATWCGPCQQPMAELQKIRQAHSNWGDKVAIVPVSIDDTMEIVRKHINERNWTNTFNVWAGEGGWLSATAKTFRVTQVPTTYVLDAGGKIVYSGYPDDSRLAEAIDDLLK